MVDVTLQEEMHMIHVANLPLRYNTVVPGQVPNIQIECHGVSALPTFRVERIW